LERKSTGKLDCSMRCSLWSCFNFEPLMREMEAFLLISIQESMAVRKEERSSTEVRWSSGMLAGSRYFLWSGVDCREPDLWRGRETGEVLKLQPLALGAKLESLLARCLLSAETWLSVDMVSLAALEPLRSREVSLASI